MSRPSATRVVLSNVYSDDNRGGAAITLAHIEALRRGVPDVEIGLYAVPQKTTDPTILFRHTLAAQPDIEVHVPARPRRGWVHAVKLAAAAATKGAIGIPAADRLFLDAPLVIGKGGQAFRGYGTLRGALSSWTTLFPLVLASRRGAVTAVYGVTVGPFRDRDPARRVAAFVLRRLSHVYCRDDRSRQVAIDLGASPDIVDVVPDIVFSSRAVFRAAGASTRDAMRATLEDRLGPGAERVCAVTIKTFLPDVDDASTLHCIASTLERLHGDGQITGVAIVLQGDARSSRDDDMGRRLLTRLQTSCIPSVYVDDDLSVADVCGLYANATLTIGCRLHSSVLAAVVGCPAVAVEGGRRVKASDVLGQVGLGHLAVSLHGTDPSDDLDRVHAAAARVLQAGPDSLTPLAALDPQGHDLAGVMRSLVAEARATTQRGHSAAV